MPKLTSKTLDAVRVTMLRNSLTRDGLSHLADAVENAIFDAYQTGYREAREEWGAIGKRLYGSLKVPDAACTACSHSGSATNKCPACGRATLINDPTGYGKYDPNIVQKTLDAIKREEQ